MRLEKRRSLPRPWQHRTVRITTLGDLLLDVIASLDEPLAPDDDRVATTRVTPAGRPRTSPRGRPSLGADARLVRKRGADAAGELVDARARGARRRGRRARRGRTGVVVAIAAAGERTMVSDRGSRARARDRTSSSRPGSRCDALHVSGYALMREPVALRRRCVAGELARAAGARSRSTSPSWTLIDDAFRAAGAGARARHSSSRSSASARRSAGRCEARAGS